MTILYQSKTKANRMRVLIVLALVWASSEARKHEGKGLMPLIKTCQLQDVCAEGTYGPLIVKNAKSDCREYVDLDKYDVFGEGENDDDENSGCTEVRSFCSKRIR